MESGLRETLSINGNTFTFELCRQRDEELGPVTIDHWWMPVTELYAQRQCRDRENANHRQVIDFYWQAVIAQEATGCRPAQERYLLANLLPDVRSQGSRRIFGDAFLRRGSSAERNERLCELNNLLASGDSMEFLEFHEQTLGLLGQLQYPEETREHNATISSQLFDEACQELSRGQFQRAIGITHAAWDELMRQIGRRAGHTEGRMILDMLSYESRAAFHHCYSLLWSHLLPHLDRQYALGRESLEFLRIWHFALVDPDSTGASGCISLFHGHVFGLHPGTGPILLPQRGRDLVGTWVSDPSESNFKRLLHGFYVALYHYTTQQQGIAAERRQHTQTGVTFDDFPAVDCEEE